jgi:hypothetical protein
MSGLNKREQVTGMTPLPDGNYAEHVWSSISPAMRQVLAAATGGSRSVLGQPRTLDALARRGLVRTAGHGSDSGWLTDQGAALVDWLDWMETGAL